MTKKCLPIIVFALVLCMQVSAQVQSLPFSNYIQKRGGLVNVEHAINTRKDVTVAFLGGSITYNPGWRQMVCGYLKDSYPKVNFRFIAAGIPSLGSLPHVFRLQRDVLDSAKIDLLFLEAAVNDQVNGTDSVTQVKSLEGIVRHALKSNPYMDIVMMSFADPDKTNLYRKGLVPTSVANHELVAGHYNLPSINLAKAVTDKLANKEFDWDKDFKDLHPAPFGQRLYFEAIRTLLAAELSVPAKTRDHTDKHDITKIPLLNPDSFTNGSYLNISNAHTGADWTLYKSWTPTDHIGVRDGFVKVPVLEGTKAGSTLTLPFKGNAIGMAVVSGADAGIVKYSIDNGPEKQIDLYTQWSSSLHLPWYVLFASGLKEGSHQLRLTISSDKNKGSAGNACRIVYFLVNK
ncbi:SGNH/GDSL hydrolase family protein [Mucilaginibacter corticis]|uniref:SGNH/GDSL hydrolase family protein n=1 Tax=Mucilaginibacter corticis TaxID=2597670 RepID=A0A556MWX8_9SPHI|nr:SGNH/GDSL hydrolase family protein [Mucilaginibacter corticis]TSJ44373.1 SGNH/GDSL hydrolase family protein [Mucilaginibacter corticis]